MTKDNKVSNFNNKSKGKFRKKKSYYRYKFCYLTKNRIEYIDYKDTELLKRFISKSGKIIPRYISGTKCKFQKHIALAIKRARFMSLLSYSDKQEQERST